MRLLHEMSKTSLILNGDVSSSILKKNMKNAENAQVILLELRKISLFDEEEQMSG